MRNFDVKDLLVSIQLDIEATDQDKRAAESHVQGSFLSLQKGRRLELSVRCTQPSKAILQAYNVTREGPTKRKLQGSATDPCPCPSKAPEEAFNGIEGAGQSSCSFPKTDAAQTLAELKQMLASMQAVTEPVL
jgi:hypothetical protein